MFDSNVVEGARLALSLDPDVLLVEGSGAALPPVDARPHGLRHERRARAPTRRSPTSGPTGCCGSTWS